MAKDGLRGCRMTIAHGLAKYRLGESIVDAFMTKDQPAFMQYLIGWRHQLCNILASDPEGLLGRQYPSLAHRIPEAFPCYDVLQKYVRPLTTFSINKDVNCYRIESSQPCLKRLVSFCEQQF